jgi:cyclophilin family peptidyl-prolyl cis-trans isomerase
MTLNPSRKSLLKRILGNGFSKQRDKEDPRRGRLLLESLEKRAMLAGDADFLCTNGEVHEQNTLDLAAEINSDNLKSDASLGFEITTSAEGEAAADLVQFAKDLTAAGVKFFGAAWCEFCSEQKQLFADGSNFLPFIEVTSPDRSLNSVGVAENIETFPTWEFPDGTRATGVQTLQTLSDRSGVAIPQGVTPSFLSLGNQIVQIGSPLHLAVDAYSPSGEPLTVTVSVSDPSLVEATVLTGNRSIRIDLDGYEDMVFELFEQRAETASGRVIQLAQDGFYDGIIFHRVVNGFVIQGGDPTGTGTSGSSLGNFDDDYHPDLQHNREGVLSFAKSSDDTNNSQFFVTEVPTRFLDFNHSVFGQLVEGSDVREAISETAVNASSRPLNDVTITTIDVFEDTENSVIMLKPTGAGTGVTSVTVTVTDQSGNDVSETIDVSVVADSANSQPYLSDLTASVTSQINTPAELQLSSVDIEGDAVTYFGQSLSSASNGTVSVDSISGLVTVTPADGFIGTITAQVGVAPGSGVFGNGASDSDTQRVSFIFQADTLPAPTSIDLSSGSDSGTSSTDNITRTGTLSFLISGLTSGSTVNIIDTDSLSLIGTGTAAGTTAIITTSNIAALGDGTYNLAAFQSLGGVSSPNSPSISLRYDTTPPASVVDSAATQANVGRPYETDLISNEEGSGIIYGLVSGPSGLSITPSTGVITWTPIASQVGDHTVEISLTDLAGNVRTESFTINVGEAPTAEVRLELTDLSGNAVSSLAVGDSFLLKMIAVDARAFSQPGIYGAYADILFDSNLVQVQSETPIEYGNDFGVLQKGTVLAGEINELGAVSSSIAASNLAESLIATVRFKAVASGVTNFRSDPADDANSEFLMFGIDTQIPASAISYGSVPLTIGQSFTANDDSVTVAEDSGATTIDVLSNDDLLSGVGSLTVISVTQPASGGSAALNTGVVSFTPSENFNGTSTFTYRVSDSQGIQQTATVTVTVQAVNDPPTGIDDVFSVDQDSGNNFLNVLANDSSAPDTGETLKVTGLTPSGTTAEGATISVAPDGAGVFYQPATGFSGVDSFAYTLSDGTAQREVSVSVTVQNPDNPPTAEDDTFSITEDDAEAAYDLLANDTQDIDGQNFYIDSVSVPDSGGSVRISSDGLNFFYQPAPNFNGTETFTYVLRDSGGGSSVGTVQFEVESVNDAPPVVEPSLNRNRGGSNQSVFTLNDLPENPDAGETLTITVESPSSEGGTVEVESGTQTIRYTPPTGFIGTDTITYIVSDGSDLSSTGTITIEVTDYEPRTIQLVLPKPASDLTITGITITGTDASGNAVEQEIDYGTENAEFNGLMPGDYTIRIPAIPFLQNAETPREINITSDSDDGDAVVESAIGRLRPEFISIRDWLRSTPKNSILVAIAPGESSRMVAESSVANFNSPQINLDGTGSLLTIQKTETTTNDDDETVVDVVQATVDTSDRSLAEKRGERDGMLLYRIATDQLTFSPVLNSNGQGEGEAIDRETTTLPLSGAAEGEWISNLETPSTSDLALAATNDSIRPVASQASTVVDLFVPNRSAMSGDSSVMVLATGEAEIWESNQMPDETATRPFSSFGSVPSAPSIAIDQTQLAGERDSSSLIDQLANDQQADQQATAAAVDQILSQGAEN